MSALAEPRPMRFDPNISDADLLAQLMLAHDWADSARSIATARAWNTYRRQLQQEALRRMRRAA